MSSTATDNRTGALGEPDLRRGRRLLLTENGFASALGATLSGQFLTALVLAMGGSDVEIGIVMAAGNVGALGMLVTNPALNRVGSRRKVCLVDLGIVRGLRLVIAAIPVLVFCGFGRDYLLVPVVACVSASAFFGMSAEVSRRSWIADLVPPSQRGGFFARRIMIGSSTSVAVWLIGGRLLDFFKSTGQPLLGPPVLVTLGFLLGVVSWILIWRAPEPPMVRPRRQASFVQSLLLPWKHPRFRPVIVAGLMWGLAVGFAADFFALYMMQVLHMQQTWIAAVNTSGELVSIACAPFFGALADRSGARRVLGWQILVKAFFPAAWILVMPQTWYLAFIVILFCSVNSAGGIAWLRLSLNCSPSKNQAAYLSMHPAMQGFGQAVGALLGGVLLRALRGVDLGSIAGITIVPLHLLFALSMVLRLNCLALLPFIHEPKRMLRAQPQVALAEATEAPPEA